ncbi:MAG: AAA domain-containing protein [Saprospiraceae bacterium]
MKNKISNNVATLFDQELTFSERFLILNEKINELICSLDGSKDSIYFSQKDRIHKLYKAQAITSGLYQRLYNFLHKSEFENESSKEHNLEKLYPLGLSVLTALFQSSADHSFPPELINYVEEESLIVEEAQIRYWPEARANLLSLSDEFLELSIIEDELEIIKIKSKNIEPLFLTQLEKAVKINSAVIPLYLHELSFNNNEWNFGILVLYPDYLIDVTAVAECYDAQNNSVLRQFINLFSDRLLTKSMLVGTAVNEFLDELILDPESQYKDLLKKVFYKYALGITALNEQDSRDFFNQTEKHFHNLQQVVNNHFENKIHNLKDCLLEPSFYSVKYGIQGRLDVLVANSKTDKIIIELKSGSPYNPNTEGISPSHQAQACLYNMLLESVYGKFSNNESYILYSILDKNNLRRSLDQQSLRRKLIELRNSILLIHIHLVYTSPAEKTMFDFIQPSLFEKTNNFTRRDASKWLTTYQNLEEIEKNYLKQFSYFIAREQLISKCGLYGQNQTQGLASLWLLTNAEKEIQYSILSNLVIQEVQQSKHDTPIIILKNTGAVNYISQFRIGDTLILYPQTEDGKGMLQSLVFKCTMILIEGNIYQVRLRGRQFETEEKFKNISWCLENDSMDKPFLYQFSNLFEFAQATPEYRKKILGLNPPTPPLTATLEEADNNEALIKRMIEARDYFLLWGPPGSGKTSIIISKLIEKLHSETNQNILLLAYTNRAVDEICEVLESLSFNLKYIRVGSRYGTKPAFHSKLFDQQVASINSRKELKNLLSETRIFTATIASIQGKRELFKLKQFDLLIIDEASQILEPNLIGMLSRFEKFILIGDHLQLPAVSAQTDETCVINHEDLNKIGFEKLNESLFERLFRQCKSNDWNYAFDMLKKQGRMHRELMSFPSHYFYEGQLDLMDVGLKDRQNISLVEKFVHADSDSLTQCLKTNRSIFISCNNTENIATSKSNVEEAELVVQVLQRMYKLYKDNNLEWNWNSCGIITPFRVQISTIISKIAEADLSHIPVTIDTVERYQGSARDIIIISSCVKSKTQLEQISSINNNGIDRKLNVALTRAREQIILIGNYRILKNSEVYSNLIKAYYNFESE